jgi:hypothetical protein
MCKLFAVLLGALTALTLSAACSHGQVPAASPWSVRLKTSAAEDFTPG